MCDLSYVLRTRNYPEAFGLINESFASQPTPQTCGAAAIRHGLLLGGLLAPVSLLESLLEIRNNWGTDDVRLLETLRRLGFEVEQRTRPPTQSTADFLSESDQLAQGGFLLPCLNYGEGGHWVCLGAWDGTRAWLVDSYTNDPPHFHFLSYTAQEFHEAALDDDGNLYINVVRPGHWAQQYRDWLPARRALLRMPLNADLTSMEAAVGIATHQYLNDTEYEGYTELGLYLPGGVAVTVQVYDPGADAVLARAEGVGEDRVLVFRRASGMLTGQTPAARVRRRRRRRSSPVQGTLTQQTPPELVVRAGLLHAAWLG